MAFQNRGGGGRQPPKDNSGALFPNDRKQGENDPDKRGRVMVAGREYFVSGWFNRSRAGAEYESLKFTPVNEQRSRDYQRPPQRDERRDHDRPARRDDYDRQPPRDRRDDYNNPGGNNYARAREGRDDRGMLDDEIPF